MYNSQDSEMVTKTASLRNLGFFERGEEGKENDLRRNIITVKIIFWRPDEAAAEKDKLQ